jgi:integrase
MTIKRVQRRGTKCGPKGLILPQYLTRKANTYYFRQGVPAELRDAIGRREIKKSLGSDYAYAVRECKRYAVVADNILADARARLDAVVSDPLDNVRQAVKRTHLVKVREVTPALEAEIANWIREAYLESDQARRRDGSLVKAKSFNEYGRDIEAGLTAMKRQVATGQVAPMMKSMDVTLWGCGYDLSVLPVEGRRQIGHAIARGVLEAYHGMSKRQAGEIVDADLTNTLPNQYILQNTKAPVKGPDVTWQNLYDVWVGECSRRENTKAAYLAAMHLFMEFCGSKFPQDITREDALAFRDQLLGEDKAHGTVTNKLGFIGTLFNSGRNSAKYAKFLPHNPFSDIKVKKAKRGKAGMVVLPFSDAELKKIFESPIYTAAERPEGGAGEAAAWIPMLGYLTGMRLEEIATLHVRQFQQDAKGNHYIHTEDGKNENSSDRDVPLHPALIEAGLLEYVRGCKGRLFPKVRSANEVESRSYSKWFGRHLDSLKITSRSKVFHSFRHLFKDLCKNAGIEDSAVDQICGHEPGTVGGKYGQGCRIDVLADLVARIEPPIPLPRIIAP